MDVQKYCEDMGVELSIWEKELNDVLNVLKRFLRRGKSAYRRR